MHMYHTADRVFLSTLSLRRATRRTCHKCDSQEFLSTLSLRRATGYDFRGRVCQGFLSTLSLRRATTIIMIYVGSVGNFYPRSPCGERLPDWSGLIPLARISIHALLAESDVNPYKLTMIFGKISIHALLAESDLVLLGKLTKLVKFLSTLSLRRATALR